MTKILEEGRTKKYRGSGRVPFLANLETFKQEINQGWPIRAVYDRYAEKLDISYAQFSRYVKKYITGAFQEKPAEKPAQGELVPAVIVKSRLNDAAQLDDTELF